MHQLLGEYECKIDAKGRMRLPSSLTNQVGEGEQLTFVINRGFEQCLNIYPESVWETITKEINQLNIYKKENRKFVRYFYRGAQKVTLDSAGRILISKRLLEYAGVNKVAVLAGVNDKVELWSSENYDGMIDDEPDDFADLAEGIFDKIYNDAAGE